MNCLETLHPDLAAQWHPTLNDRSSAEVTAGSNHAAWWLGLECGHEWQAAVYARVNGNNCPTCWASTGESRQETQLREHLAAYLPLDLDRRVQRTHGRRAGHWKVDILCSALKLIIEFDGSYWHGAEFPAQLADDQAKAEDLRAQGYTVIRIREAPLTPLHPHDVTVPYLADPVDVARIVLTRLRVLGIHTPSAAA
jgi:very-short-patch-repair endonuclease